ncbi:MAG: hypothetical protein NVSMB14_02670 [Isosphaeraceae bacterium]
MILIGTDGGIYRWFEGTPWPIFHALQGMRIVAVASRPGGVLVAAAESGAFLESRDNGLNWTDVPPPAWHGGASAMLLLGVAKPIAVLATKSAGLFRRYIGGEGWTPLANPTATKQGASPLIRALAATPGLSPIVYAAVAGEGLWKSVDAGQAWSRCAGLPAEANAIRLVDENIVLLATNDGVWKSEDQGNAWIRVGSPEKITYLTAIEFQPDDPKHLFAGGSGAASNDEKGPAPFQAAAHGLFESKDAGKTWAHVFNKGFPEELEHDSIVDIRFNPSETDSALVALASGEIWRTNNSGDWWEPLARQIRGARSLCAVG